MATLPKDVQESVITSADSLIAQQTTTRQEQATADSGIIAPDSQQKTATESVAEDVETRLTIPQQGGGIRLGRDRNITEDMANQAVFENIVADKVAQGEIATVETSTDVVVSRQQAVQSLVSQTTISPRREQETGRALQKLQRTCNHKYNKASRRCIYCSKHRDSHVYDVGNMIL